MPCINNTEKLLGLQDVIIKNIAEEENSVIIEIEMPRKTQECPCCSSSHVHVHDYRNQKIKDIKGYGKNTILNYKKRRYVCCECKKRFAESNTFVARYHQHTKRLIANIIIALTEYRSYTSVAKENNVSTSTVIRFFDAIQYPKPKTLSNAIGIDEFKGNTGGEKYNVILTNLTDGSVLDIIQCRKSYPLTQYFKSINRQNVQFFVSDMWKPYDKLADNFFSNATKVVDRYHFVRQVVWAFEAVRKEQQKRFSKSHRIYFKNSKSLLLKQYHKLDDEQKTQVNVMLYTSAELSSAYFLKEKFWEMYSCKDKDLQRKMFSDWILMAQSSEIKSFVNCANTFINWSCGILNALQFPYSNGFTEGCNNKIKVLKRNAFGYSNFNRMRNRIIHIFSNKLNKQQNVA